MKWLLAIFITIGLLTAFYVVSALVYFDLTWILIGITSLWAGIDSKKIELYRYKTGIRCRPAALFCCCYLLWIFTFPYYLWARFKIKAGEAALKEEAISNISPAKHFLRRFSHVAGRVGEWCLIGLVGLKFAFLIFFIEESWRGPLAWKNYKNQLEAKGESLDWDAMIPPQVPDAQNFFSAPMMSAWFIKPSGKIVITEDLSKRFDFTNALAPLLISEITTGQRFDSKMTATIFDSNDSKSATSARQQIQNIIGPSLLSASGNQAFTAKPVSQDQIKQLPIFLETEKKLNAGEVSAFMTGRSPHSDPLIFKSLSSNSWQIAIPTCPASDYLKWSDQFTNIFALMREATKRPFARMAGDYHYPPTIPIPNFVNVRAVSQTLAQRAQCYLLLGQPDKALQELTLLNDLRRLLEGAPTGKPMTLVAAMLNVAVVGLYADTVADGFRLHAWKEPQIIELQKQLEQINLSPFLKESLHVEQASAWCIMQTVMTQFEIQRTPDATLWQKIKNVRPPNIMRGFIYFNILNTVRLEEMIVESIDPSQRVVSPQKAAAFKSEVDALDRIKFPFNFYKLFAAIAVPNFSKAMQTFAFNQTKADEAQIVCALEHYHLTRGKYPETLSELSPQFIQKLPLDIIGGQPLKYRRTADGQFLLYSTGWNETDEGGQFSSSPYDKGDWVWE